MFLIFSREAWRCVWGNSYLGSIQRSGDHFRSHPVWGSYQGLSLGDIFADLSTESKV